jgi:cytochrome c biogenesis protein
MAYRPEGLDDAFANPSSDTTTLDAAQGPPEPVAGGREDTGPDARAAGGPPAGSVPAIGVVGWLRWAWRQLTSMRVALLLLVLLAVAAVPGTVFPQRGQDAAKVAAYLTSRGAVGTWLDRLGFFDVYTSTWFSAIYLLLFVSLVGCILPRSRQHWSAVRARPPRTPRQFSRFPAQASASSPDAPEAVVRRAAAVLGRWRRYRVDVHDEGGGTWSASAERGHLRETGNLAFHLALVGLLVAVAYGQLLHYRAQVIVVAGDGFANAQTSFDTFERGRAFDPATLEPFTLRLDDFESAFDPVTLAARDFTARVTLTEPGAGPSARIIKVNDPLSVGGTQIYLMGNGYAPEITVHDASDVVALSGPVPFLPQDQVYTSRGVVKVPDVSGGQPQIGLVGYLLPTAVQTPAGSWISVRPQPTAPLLVLSVWSGDLGLDTGVPQNVYRLDESGLTQAVDSSGAPVTLVVRPGQTVTLPNDLGTLTFDGIRRYAAFDLRRDPALGWLLGFALAALAGLAASLFTPRRRLWLRAAPAIGGEDRGSLAAVTAAGLARGDDIGLAPELGRILAAVLGTPVPVTGRAPAADDARGDSP